MRQVLTTVYGLSEIPDERTRQNAIDALRYELIAEQAQEIYGVVDQIENWLLCWNEVSAKELRTAADQVGWCWGFDIVESYISRTRMHGYRLKARVMAALEREADEIVKRFDDNPETAFSDDDVIAHADANECEYTKDGKLI